MDRQFYIIVNNLAIGPWFDEISCERFGRRAPTLQNEVWGLASIPGKMHYSEWWSGENEDVPSYVVKHSLLGMYGWDEGACRVQSYEEVFGEACFVEGTKDNADMMARLSQPKLSVDRLMQDGAIGEFMRTHGHVC